MEIEKQIEAILFFKGEPVSRKKLSEILRVGQNEINEGIEKLKENLKEKRKVEIVDDAIEIYGMTPGSQILDDWMERMERFAKILLAEVI